jgi:hypothetical protein
VDQKLEAPPFEQVTFPLSTAQVGSFTAQSAPLGAALRSADIARIQTAYEREDQRAMAAQQRFVHVAHHLNASVLATAVIGALILALGLLKPWLVGTVETWFDNSIPWILAVLGFGGLLVSGYAAARLYELNAGDLAGDWMRSRARAEQLRSEYFDRLVARIATADVTTHTTALDLVNRHLLEDQLAYFMQRGKRHEEMAGRWLRRAAFATGVASVGVATGGLAGAAGQPWILAIAALGSIGSAIAAFAAAQETIGQEKERAQRFRNNVDALELLARQSDQVRSALDAGSSEALAAYTSAINHQLALELGRFLEGGESVRASIAKLKEQMEDNRKVQKQPGDGDRP